MIAQAEMNALIEAQVDQGKSHAPGPLHVEIRAERAGVVASIDKYQIARIAGLASAHMSIGTGVDLLKHIGDPVTAGEPLYRVHAELRADFEFARNLSQRHSGYCIDDKCDAQSSFVA